MITIEDFNYFVYNQKCKDCPISIACHYNINELSADSICTLISDHNEPD